MHRALLIVCAVAGSAAAAPLILPSVVIGHCEVPCGIYDDPARIARMQEDVTSIRKAMDQMAHEHASGTLQGFNQATRWVIEKGRAADDIQEIASVYFLTQRIKAVAPAESIEYGTYLAQLRGFHAVMVAAMKCKQQTDPAAADALEAAVAHVAQWYPG